MNCASLGFKSEPEKGIGFVKLQPFEYQSPIQLSTTKVATKAKPVLVNPLDDSYFQWQYNTPLSFPNIPFQNTFWQQSGTNIYPPQFLNSTQTIPQIENDYLNAYLLNTLFSSQTLSYQQMYVLFQDLVNQFLFHAINDSNYSKVNAVDVMNHRFNMPPNNGIYNMSSTPKYNSTSNTPIVQQEQNILESTNGTQLSQYLPN